MARDVPEITALGSVALMLMVLLVLENPRRGILLGFFYILLLYVLFAAADRLWPRRPESLVESNDSSGPG